jgi:CHAT domain-containing protein
VAHYAGLNRPLHRAEPAARAAATRLARDWNLECRHVTDREACFSLLSSAAVLFYFGHGHFDASDVDASGIEFGDPSRTPDSTGLISLRDLDGVDLTCMRHAIVFACHGSDAVPYAGRWAVGLPHMLLRRGARSVLASMWETAPEIAEEVSDVFLERARRVGCANALREAQLRVLRSGRGVDPFWWAAFQFYGDDSRP